MNRWRIRPRVAVTVLTVLAVLMVAAATTFLLWNLRVRELNHARGETVSLSHILAEQTTRTLQNVDLVLQNTDTTLAEFAERGEPFSRKAVYEVLVGRLTGLHPIRGMFVVDADGLVANSSRRFPGERESVADREYFRAHLANPGLGLYVGAPIRGRHSGAWTLPMSRRISGPGGEFRGVLVVSLNLGYFETLYESISFDGISPIALYLVDGTLVTSQPRDDNAVGTRVVDAQAAWFGNSDSRTSEETTGAGEPRIVTYHRSTQFPLMVGVAISQEMVLGHWRDKARIILAGAFCVIALVLIAAWALTRELRKEEALERELHESGERLQATIDSAMDAIVIVDADQHVILFNPAAERMFGCTAQEAVGAPLERFLPQRYRAAHRSNVERFGASGVGSRVMASQLDIVGLRADGREFPLESTISQVKLHGQTLYTAILRDVTERRRAEAELRDMNRQLRGLSSSLQDVREQERTRIARELHDELGQQLTGLKLDLSWLSGRLREGRPAAPEKVDEMRRLLETTIAAVRRISTELRPAILDDLGFGEAVAWQTGEFAKRSGLAIELDLPAAALVRDDALATALFRIVQESLTNIVRHAGATRAQVRLADKDDGLVLTISDDGRGLSADVRQNGGIGLVSMRERATALGGNFAIVSSPAAGTTIEVTVPLPEPAPIGEEA